MRYCLLTGLMILVGLSPRAEANYWIFRVDVTKLKGGPAVGNPLTVSVIVETKGPPSPKGTQFMILHRWGRTTLFRDAKGEIDNGPPQQAPGMFMALPNLRKEWEVRQKELAANRAPEARLEVCEWLLSRGMLHEFETTMDDLAKGDAAHPAVKAAITAYRKVRADLLDPDSKEPHERSLSTDEALIKTWKMRAGGNEPFVTRHFAVLYDFGVINPPEVKTHADRLENVFHGFYYWWALKGRALPVPKRRLVAVFISSPEKFDEWHAAFGSPSLPVDAFYSPGDNLAVYSAVRRDEAYKAFAVETKRELWGQGWNLAQLLVGQGQKRGSTIAEWARAQTLALIQKSLQDEGEWQIASHVGTQQLVCASGLLSPQVVGPEWLRFGMSSFFEISKGSLWPGYGGSSWSYLVEYKVLEKAKQLQEKPDQPLEATKTLERVLTDYYFHQARKSTDPLARKRARLLAWSLTYFLAQRRRVDGTSGADELGRYYEELAKLPRHLEFDSEVYLHAFARAYGLADPSKPRGIDPDKFGALALEWQKFIWNATPPIRLQDALQLRNIMKNIKDLPPGN